MNRCLKILVATFTVLCIVGGLVLLAFSYMNNSSKQIPLGYFYEKENSVDGIIIGTSSAYRFWIPTEAYANHGAVIGCYASHSLPFVTYKYMIEAALRDQNPEFIAIELRNISQDPKQRVTKDITDLTNHMPATFTRLKLIDAVLKFDKELDTDMSDDPSAYRYPESEDAVARAEHYCERYSIYKGFPLAADSFDKSKFKDSIEWTDDVGEMPYNTEETLNELLDYCETLECDVIFFLTPCALKYDRQIVLNKALEIAKGRGFTTRNFNLDNERGLIDLQDKDYYNDRHTNVYGAIKFTEYMYQYLDDIYNLEDHRGDNAYQSWDKAAELFRSDVRAVDSNISFEYQ